MVYRQQNFLENLQNGVKYGDFDAITDALAPEIGLLASEDKPALVKAVQAAGISVSNDVEDEKLFKVIIKHLFEGDKKLIHNVIVAILKNKEEFSNATDIVSGALELAGTVATATGQIAAAKLQQQQEGTKLLEAKEGTKGKQNDLLAQIASAKAGTAQAVVGAKSAAASNKTLVIGLSIAGGLIVIGTVAYFALKTPAAAVIPPVGK